MSDYRKEMRAAGSVCDSGGAHHPDCVEQHDAELPGTVGIEQGRVPRAQSIKKELFALWE